MRGHRGGRLFEVRLPRRCVDVAMIAVSFLV
jgi:hypothetical protein